MTIQEILEAHLKWYFPDGDSEETRCLCGHVIAVGDGAQKMDMAQSASFAHVAEVLDKHMQEQCAEAWDRLVDYAPFTVFERVRLRCENPFREEPNDA